MNKTSPPDYLLPILMEIEMTTLRFSKEFRRMQDKDVEWVYDHLHNYYQGLSKNKEIDEPLSSMNSRQGLSDEILNLLETREEAGADSHLVDSIQYMPSGFPIPTIYHAYATCLRYLIRSAKGWRKEFGAKGYLKFLDSQIGHFLDD